MKDVLSHINFRFTNHSQSVSPPSCFPVRLTAAEFPRTRKICFKFKELDTLLCSKKLVNFEVTFKIYILSRFLALKVRNLYFCFSLSTKHLIVISFCPCGLDVHLDNFIYGETFRSELLLHYCTTSSISSTYFKTISPFCQLTLLYIHILMLFFIFSNCHFVAEGAHYITSPS